MNVRSYIFLMTIALTAFGADLPPKGQSTVISHGFSLLNTPLKYNENFTHLSYVNPGATKGGVLKLHAIGTFDSLNPYILKGNFAASTTLPLDTLMTTTADEVEAYYGLVAQKIEIPADRAWVIFYLRPEARWHDGAPITAEDVAFSYEILLQKGLPSYRSVLEGISKVEILEPLKIKFTFKHPEERDSLAIPALMPIFSKQYFAKNEFDKTTLTPALASGPYKIADVKAGHSITFERVKNYWGKDLPINKGQYNFDRIQIDYYRDDLIALEAFKAGEIDVRQEFSSKIWNTEYNFPAVKKGVVITESIRHQKPVGLQGLFFNVRREKFQDRRVRKALGLVFDFEWLNKNLFYGRYQRSLSIFENSPMAGAAVLPSASELKRLEPFRKQLPAEVFNQPFKTPAHDTREHTREHMNEAGKLLDAAGWRIKKGKRVNVKGEVFTLEILLASASLEKTYQFYLQNLQKLGIEASIRIIDPAQYQTRRQKFDYDAVSMRFAGSQVPGIEQEYRWGSLAAEQVGSPNVCGMKNPVVDVLVAQLAAAKTLPEITEIARALDRVLMWEYYFIPAWYRPYHDIAYWNKFGRPSTPAPYIQMVGSAFSEPIASAHLWWAKK